MNIMLTFFGVLPKGHNQLFTSLHFCMFVKVGFLCLEQGETYESMKGS